MALAPEDAMLVRARVASLELGDCQPSPRDVEPVTDMTGCFDARVELTWRGKGKAAAPAEVTLHLGPTFAADLQAQFAPRADAVAAAVVERLLRTLRSKADSWRRAAERVMARLQAADLVVWFHRQPEVVLSAEVRARMNALGEAYTRRSRELFTLTSGTRSAEAQARALEVKLRLGDDIVRLYKAKDAARAIRDAWKAVQKAKGSREEAVAAMTAVIEGQMARGLYLSRHLLAGAVDVRIRDMNAADRKAFKAACDEVGRVKVLQEARPPHWHLELQGLGEGSPGADAP